MQFYIDLYAKIVPIRKIPEFLTTNLHLVICNSISEIHINCQHKEETKYLFIYFYIRINLQFYFCIRCSACLLLEIYGEVGHWWHYLCCQRYGCLPWSGGSKATNLNWLNQMPSALETPGRAESQEEERQTPLSSAWFYDVILTRHL